MKATESGTTILRRMLDERGVKWEARTSPRGRIWTYWDAFNGHRVYAMDNENGTVEIFGEWDVTPAQAVEATLGRGTCELVETEHEQEIDAEFGKGTFSYWAYDCSECGYENAQRGRFCAGCGREVVDE